jgi:hypothetical protein
MIDGVMYQANITKVINFYVIKNERSLDYIVGNVSLLSPLSANIIFVFWKNIDRFIKSFFRC